MTIKTLLQITTFLDLSKRNYNKELFDLFFHNFKIQRCGNTILIINNGINVFCEFKDNRLIDYDVTIIPIRHKQT